MNKYPLYQRLRIIRKIINYKEIELGILRANIKRGANLYAMQYLKQFPDKYVRLIDIQDYCSKMHKMKTGNPLGDPPRAFESLRKDKLPCEWSEITYKKNKYVKSTPRIKNNITKEIYEKNKNKKDSFNKEIIDEKLKETNYTCEITGLPISEGSLAADHFIPKEKGGKSIKNNCIILNKILNEKKNNHYPIEWFCKTLLTNFMNICKKVGILDECKEKIIKFIQEF